jgi:hypothetical protein
MAAEALLPMVVAIPVKQRLDFHLWRRGGL